MFLLPSKIISAQGTLQKKFIKEKGLMELLAPDRTQETRDEDIYEGFANMFKIKNFKIENEENTIFFNGIG